MSLSPAGQRVIGAAATLCGLYPYYPYARGIRRGETTPHAFSWFLWTVSAAITFAVQYTQGGGPGAWAAGTTMFATCGIAVWSLRRGNKDIARSDWLALGAALTTLPLWYVTQTPLYAIALLSLMELFAFYPTFRKSWAAPHSEVLQIYVFGGLMYALSLFALTDFTLTNALYPATIATTNTAFIVLVLLRRRQLDSKTAG